MVHPDPTKPYFVETDASDFALAGILSQEGEDHELHPIAFHSRKFNPAEINYPIHDKELLAIVDSFLVWRRFLEGCPHTVTVFSDHRNLEYFQSARVLNRRQARWYTQVLSQIPFLIQFRPGRLQGQSDALSRRSYLAPKVGEAAFDQQSQIILGPDRLQLAATTLYSIPQDMHLLDEVRDSFLTDDLATDVIHHLNSVSPSSTSSRQDYDAFEVRDGLLYRHGLLHIPKGRSRLHILQTCHDSALAGHFGVMKTIELISRNYWWPSLRKSVASFVQSCDTCARAKTPRHLPYGLLHPLPVPEGPWKSISIDFITDLPSSQDHNAILVVVDRFSKMAHFIPCSSSITSEITSTLFIREIFRLHGLPDNIISDRGPQFIAGFWKRLLELLHIDRSLSSGHHPESNGQTERTNQTLEQYLHCFISYQQDDWVDWLPMAEFAYNNSVHSSTKQTPFFTIFGQHPRWSFIPDVPTSINPQAEHRLQQLQQVHVKVRDHLQQAQNNFQRFANRYRHPTPNFQIGDLVWLLRQDIATKRPCAKLDFRRLGPFRIIAQINDVAYRLKLPSSCKLHPVFHVSVLEPYKNNTIPDRAPPPHPPIEIEGAEEFEVRQILDSKIARQRLYYLVDWEGYAPCDRTWEPMGNLANAAEKVAEFHERYPHKPKVSDSLKRRVM